jgi:hypothetical protein
VLVYGHYDFPKLMIPRIAGTGTSFSPDRAKHHTGTWLPTPTACLGVEVGADGLLSASSYEAAAAAPPAGADIGLASDSER